MASSVSRNQLALLRGWKRMRLDAASIAAGLLHDTVEDTKATVDEIEELFGEDVADIVDGVTKISLIPFETKEEAQAENIRKMILAMLEARINFIESRMPRFNVIDLATLGGEQVTFGATVEIEDVDTGDVKKYTLLGPDEAEPSKGSISLLSPVGQALLGKYEGDEIVVDAPRGKINYEIVSITFDGIPNRS